MDEMTQKLKAQAEYCNLPSWWDAGYTGRGISVWNCEGYTNTPHGKKSRERVLQAAPEATVYSGSASHKTDGKAVTARIYLETGDGQQTHVPLEEFLEKNNIRVVTASLGPAPFNHPGYKTMQYWKDLIKRYDLCCFAASANDGKRDKTFDNSEYGWWYVGAVFPYGGNFADIRRHTYSNGGEGLDFCEFVGDWSGTSAATPFLAGKCALIRQRFPEMDRFEVYDYMVKHCQDLGNQGADNLFGNGLLILPHVEKGDEDVEITKTKVLVNDKIIEVKRVMVNDENYIRLRDMHDVLGICEVDYDAARNLPIVRTK